MKRNNIGVDILKNLMEPRGLGMHVPFTEVELQQLHRSFGHPSVSSIAYLLKRARPGEMDDSSLLKSLKHINNQCKICSTTSGKSRNFKITVGTDVSITMSQQMSCF
eukprot:Plantae.Rhodophyta-Rhodochaete_pulchella.ctg37389.p4 GENE.Plantae.Rhodophyta-Rhodochaete_pulchella.ctg37389~~Plantae.Rhodophyta-Rhodochaete_pulchella.ctg37389.p4  ORF type:complete len:107 (-),score=15.07 Plantae.Rhodophyta-Rhodochaete_pulchella.ctg37389:6-326(-)